ncbi:type II secretion system F family protein [Actinophytocola sediminis]
MNTTTVLCAFLGAGFGTGLWLVLRGWRRTPPPPSRGRRGVRAAIEQHRTRALVAVVAGAAGGVFTGWVMGACLITFAVWTLPTLIGSDTAHTRRIARIEAIATWAEMLRDTLAAAAGLEQAILASAPVAPTAIHTEITALAVRLETGHRLAPSLRLLADDLADPTADLVISSLLLAATHQARALADLLGSLAATARDQATMRMRVDASRARVRTSVRIITGATLGFAGLLIVLNRDYLVAYDTATGQLVLLAVGGLFTLGFLALTTIATFTEPPRLLTPAPGTTP